MKKILFLIALLLVGLMFAQPVYAYDDIPEIEIIDFFGGTTPPSPTLSYEIVQGNLYYLTIGGERFFPVADSPWNDVTELPLTLTISTNDPDYRYLVFSDATNDYMFDILNKDFELYIEESSGVGLYDYEVNHDTVLKVADTTSAFGELSIYIILPNSSLGTYNDGYEAGQTAYHNGFTGDLDITQGSPYNQGFVAGDSYGVERVWRYGFSGTGWFDVTSHSYSVGFLAGYEDGREDYGYTSDGGTTWISATTRYDTGYEDGQDDLFDSGSTVYGYVMADSFDYGEGYDDGFFEGSKQNVNIGAVNFMNGFEKWIVPAIVIIILLGGFMTIAVMKRRGE